MNRTILAALLLPFACLAGTAAAQEIELASLGALELVFQPAQAVQRYPGRPVAATVGFRRGEAFNVPSPGRLQQIEYLVEPGAAVDKGQPFAVLRGPEMHHFEMNYDSSRELLASAERRFRANRALYERKAISESRWLEISEQYYALALEHEHMRHFFELVKEGDNDPDSLTLVAPVSGMIDYLPAQGVVQEGDNIAQFLPLGVIRLHAALPIAIRNQVAALQAGSCTLPVARVEAVTDGFFVQAWSAPLTADCDLLLGQKLLATPLLQLAGGWRLPQSAVFQWQRQAHVLLRRGERLQPVAVELLGTQGQDYVVASAVDLGASEVLVSSVSAVQGILLGLGGE